MKIPFFVFDLPLAAFSSFGECSGSETQFFDVSASNGTITNWFWSFGDPSSGSANSSLLQNPLHVFNSSGVYQVELSITDNNGCSSDTLQSVSISPSPIADFEADTACIGAQTHFSNTSSGNILSYFWNFGDGNSSSSFLPQQSFANVGNYQVSLAVLDANGCVDTLTQSVEIANLPSLGFGFDSLCQNSSVQFRNQSNSLRPLSKIEWTIEGTNYTTDVVDHLLSEQSLVLVQLTVEDELGCADSLNRTLSSRSLPTAEFTINPDFGGAPIDLEFTPFDLGLSNQWSVNDSVFYRNHCSFQFLSRWSISN